MITKWRDHEEIMWAIMSTEKWNAPEPKPYCIYGILSGSLQAAQWMAGEYRRGWMLYKLLF